MIVIMPTLVTETNSSMFISSPFQLYFCLMGNKRLPNAHLSRGCDGANFEFDRLWTFVVGILTRWPGGRD